MTLPAIERVPCEIWSMVLSRAQATPPVLLALRDEFCRIDNEGTHRNRLQNLGKAAMDDSLMVQFVGRRREAQRKSLASKGEAGPGYHLETFFERLDKKSEHTRGQILAAFESTLPFPKRRVKDADLLRAMFVHDKNAWQKAEKRYKPSLDLSWSAADFEVQGTFERSRVALRGNRTFAITCFRFDKTARLASAATSLRDDEELVTLTNGLEQLHWADTSPRLRARADIRQSLADASVLLFCEQLLDGRADLFEQLSGLRKHIAHQLQPEGEKG